MRLRLGLAVVTTLCVLTLLAPSMARAATSDQLPFLAKVNATYTVQEDASTRVKLEIRLRNTTSLQYAKSYAFQVNSPDVENVSAAMSNNEKLAVDVTQTPLQTVLAVKFPDEAPVVGREQERLFTLEYSSRDSASRYGEVLELTLPRLADPEFYEQYNVTLVVPEDFGEPSWVRPEQFTLDQIGGTRVLRFTDVAQTGISVLFGEKQVYDIRLRYHVNNPSQNAGVVEVALPSDTPWQRVWYSSITPKPNSIRTDLDGNWIAQFRLAGQASQEIETVGQIELSAQPVVPVPQISPFLDTGDTPWWSRSEGSPWLKPQSYWQTSHPLVQAGARENASAQSIYDFVVETLQYNSERARTSNRVERLGAVAALQDPGDALCQEYTDVFIALSRAAGIPARRVTGYAINQDSALRPLSLVEDVLHAWPEYYDSQQGRWIPTDPTWGDTTGGVDYFRRFDLRHLTFARQGTSDVLPLPAGQYKELGGEQQDVQVEIATRSAIPSDSESQVRLEPVTGFAWAGQPRRVRVVVENKTGLARYTIPVAIEVSGAVVNEEANWTIPVLLPFETVTKEIWLNGPDWFLGTQADVRAHLDSNEVRYVTTVRRTIQHPILRFTALGGVVALVSLGAGSLSVFGIRRFRPVRRKSKKS